MKAEEAKAAVNAARERTRKFDERPIAARLPAEPGWRAILLRTNTELDQVTIHVVPITAWALDAPKVEARDPELVPTFGATVGDGAIESLFGNLFPSPGPASPLWPLDTEGKRFSAMELHRIVPPSPVTDGELIAEVKAWSDSVVAANTRPKVKP